MNCTILPTYASNDKKESEVYNRCTYIEQYDSDILAKKVMDGSITEDEFTKIDIKNESEVDAEITSITIRELKERRIEEGRIIETFLQQTSSTRSSGYSNNATPYQSGQNSFTLNYKIQYDRISYKDGYLYKITKMEGSYTNVVGRLTFAKLVLYCSASPDAYYSTTQRHGYYSENATRTINTLTSGTTYYKNVSFDYYYYDQPNGASIGGTATIYFKVSNQTTQRSFVSSITLV